MTKAPPSSAARLLFGQAFQEARRISRQTQEDVARATGIDRSHISLIENGQANATIDTMAVLARAVGAELKITVAVSSRRRKT